MRSIGIALAVAGCVFWIMGCAQRTLTITSEPPGAVVYINGLDETLRTPGKYEFEFYGDYDIIVRHPGYETIVTHRKLKAPIHGIPPFDLLGELFGVKDRRHWHFDLVKAEEKPVDAAALISRGQALSADLQSSRYTKKPATLPSTRPSTTAPTTRPAMP